MLDCEAEWANFCNGEFKLEEANVETAPETSTNMPKCSDIYISTKTMISYLNKQIDIQNVFWQIAIMKYGVASCGVIKKQMKISFKNKEDVEQYTKRLESENYVEEYIINQMDNEKFKDVRKISIGLCKKDILNNRCKKKSAFYNCFVLIIRILYQGTFKEVHVKVFNTGKLEIPGIQSDDFLHQVLEQLIYILNTHCNLGVSYLSEKNETVLINSNFNCGFYLNRERFHDLLKIKYKLHSSFDPCSYPGIMSKFYYDMRKSKDEQTGEKPSDSDNYSSVSFMIFRTGSVLIVGRCSEEILRNIYEFIKNVIASEFDEIYRGDYIKKEAVDNKKVRKKTIILSK